MPTTLYLTNSTATVASTGLVEDDRLLSVSRGAGLVTTANTNTILGPTTGLTIISGNTTADTLLWLSNSMSAFTFSTSLNTFNWYMSESAMAANVGSQILVYRYDINGNIVSTVLNTEFGTEASTASRTVNNWTAGAGATVAFSDGDRIGVLVAGNDGGGTMAALNTFQGSYGHNSSGSDGDSWIAFADVISETTAAGGNIAPKNTLSLMGVGR